MKARHPDGGDDDVAVKRDSGDDSDEGKTSGGDSGQSTRQISENSDCRVDYRADVGRILFDIVSIVLNVLSGVFEIFSSLEVDDHQPYQHSGRNGNDDCKNCNDKNDEDYYYSIYDGLKKFKELIKYKTIFEQIKEASPETEVFEVMPE